MEEAEEAEEAEESSSQLSTEQILDSALDSMDEESVVVGKSILPQLFSKLKSQIVSLLSFLSTHSTTFKHSTEAEEDVQTTEEILDEALDSPAINGSTESQSVMEVLNLTSKS